MRFVPSFGEGVSAGGAYSWSTALGETVTAKSLQISIGLSPWFISGGYNNGVIEKK